MYDLIIVSGASKGIGNNIANKCIDICKNLLIISSTNKIKECIKSDKCNIIPVQLDLIKYSDIEEILSYEIDKISNIKSIGVVLCASQLGEYGGILNTNLDMWNDLYKCNVLGNLSILKSLKKYIENNIKIRAVFFSGGGAAFGYPEFSAYSLSKCATVRAVENAAIELSAINNDFSIIALAPGAVATDMLEKVIASGATVRTKTDISEPTNFVINFLMDKFPSKELNGKFLHVRDDIFNMDLSNKDLAKLRRIS